MLQHFLFSCFTHRSAHPRYPAGGYAAHYGWGACLHGPQDLEQCIPNGIHSAAPIALRFVTINAGKLFKTYSEQYINRTLRKIVEHLKWTIRPSTHTARHRFATNFIELRGDVVTPQGYLGHGKIQTTMKYVHISDRRKREQINVFDHFNR